MIAFDSRVAETLIAVLENAANALRTTNSSRSSVVETALEDFKGGYATLFTTECRAASDDFLRLAGVLEDLSLLVVAAKMQATAEQARQDAVAEWKRANSSRPPQPGPWALPEPEVGPHPSFFANPAPTVGAAFGVGQRRRTCAGGSMAVSSAVPDNLRGFARRVAADDTALGDQLTRVQDAWSGFTASCAWVKVAQTSFLTGFDQLLTEDQADATWIDTVASAFEAAGGSLSDADIDVQVSIAEGPSSVAQLLAGLDATGVATLWAALGEGTRQSLITDDFEQIANLDGVPVVARIEAHKLWAVSQESDAEAELDRAQALYDQTQRNYDELFGSPFASATELDQALQKLNDAQKNRDQAQSKATYLQDVASGLRQLYLYEPGQDRIIEAVGDFTTSPSEVVTYLPGTGTDLNSFYSGSVQQVTRALVKSDKSHGTVGFVYKDGPWATWMGDTANSNDQYLHDTGQQVASFEKQVASMYPDADMDGIGYSAGMSILTGTEVSGAHFDSVQSMAGSFTLSDWTPSPDTAYASYNYGNDAIEQIPTVVGALTDPTTDTGITLTPPAQSPSLFNMPNEDDTFTHNFYPTGPGDNPIDSHVRMGQGPDTNKGPIRQISLDLANSGKNQQP